MPLLFSYGTLQRPDVQRAIFGRLLEGERDELPGFELTRVPIDDPHIASAAGPSHHANATFTGRSGSLVTGTVYGVTDAEMAQADRYEAPAAYRRITVSLASHKQAWVYVDHPSSPQAAI